MIFIFFLLRFLFIFESKASTLEVMGINARDAISKTVEELKNDKYVDKKGNYSLSLGQSISNNMAVLSQGELDKYIEWLSKESKINFKRPFARFSDDEDSSDLYDENRVPFACFLRTNLEISFGYMFGKYSNQNILDFEKMKNGLDSINKVLTKLNIEADKPCVDNSLPELLADILDNVNAGKYASLSPSEKDDIVNKLVALQVIAGFAPNAKLGVRNTQTLPGKIELTGCENKNKFASVKLETLNDVEGNPQIEVFRCGKGCKDLGELYSKYLKIIKDGASKDSKYLKTNKEFFEFVNDCSSRIELRVPAQKAQENVKRPSAPAAGAVK